MTFDPTNITHTIHANKYIRPNNLWAKAKVVPNGAIINDYDGRPFYNKCFFLALVNGLRIMYGQIVNPRDLIYKFSATDNDMINLNRPDHMTKIEAMAHYYQLSIYFYYAQNKGTEWYTNPDVITVIGSGQRVIRILNENNVHFEFLERLETDEFPHTSGKELDNLIRKQLAELRQIEQEKNIHDREKSIRLAENLRAKYLLKQRQIRRDRHLVYKLANRK